MGVEKKKYAVQKNYKTWDELEKAIGTKEAEAAEREIRRMTMGNVAGVSAAIVINGSYRVLLPITHVQVHREYGVADTEFNPDVAVLTIQGSHPVYFNRANTETLYALKPGEPIAYLGFPMEYLLKRNISADNPVASLQCGNIVAVTDFSMQRFDKEGNYLIRHNLPSAGGASGSPIFTRTGEVIALHFGGNIIGQVVGGIDETISDLAKKQGGEYVDRAPSAALVNFGVRVDLLAGVDNPVPIRDFLMR